MHHSSGAMQRHGMSIDFAHLKKDDIEDLVAGLTEMGVNVNSQNGENIRVFCA